MTYQCLICEHETELVTACGREDVCDEASSERPHHHCAQCRQCTWGGCQGVAAAKCIECLAEPTEDPAPWCDCELDETCGQYGPCRRRAHQVDRCPTPGRW